MLYPQNVKEVLIQRYGQNVVEASCKFEEWLDQFPETDEDIKGYSAHLVRSLFRKYDEIHYFRVFGYGKLNKEAYDAIAENNGYNLGCTDDKTVIENIAIAMKITDKVTGFEWR